MTRDVPKSGAADNSNERTIVPKEPVASAPIQIKTILTFLFFSMMGGALFVVLDIVGFDYIGMFITLMFGLTCIMTAMELDRWHGELTIKVSCNDEKNSALANFCEKAKKLDL